MKITEFARLGGLTRARRLSPERRQEIARTASVSAAEKRRGLPAKREITKLYVAELEQRNPRLAVLTRAILAVPEAKYYIEPLITEQDWQDTIAAYSAAGWRWFEEQAQTSPDAQERPDPASSPQEMASSPANERGMNG
jgi:hypothetical protein